MKLSESPAWADLLNNHATLRGVHLRDLFATDPARLERLTAEAEGIYLDISKHRITSETLDLLIALAEQEGVARKLQDMMTGARVNTTEDRPALHTALRAPRGSVIEVDGENIVPQIHAVLDAMAEFSEALRSGSHTGATGKQIRNVIHIGIGGSHLGPRFVTDALRPFVSPALTMRFISNVDGADLHAAISGLDPAETLFIVASKTFTTTETMSNAQAARSWITASLGENAVSSHFAAVSTNLDAVEEFGIDAALTFGFWDWVGGRFSVASAIGLPVMIAIGPKAFREFLSGMHSMDQHALNTPIESNLPALMALVGVWSIDFDGAQSHAVIPYARDLAALPAHLQQLEMESNGKSVTNDGEQVSVPTAPIVWGAAGTDAQHAFLQLLHQGTVNVPVDFILVARAAEPFGDHQDLLFANGVAQAEALAFGLTSQEVVDSGVEPALVPHKTFAGNHPSSVLMIESLDPFSLGQLLSLYEHKVAIQGFIWGIDSFDQWGVALGKSLATDLIAELEGSTISVGSDASSAALIARYQLLRD